MDKRDLLLKLQQEAAHSLEMQIQAQDGIIDAQKEQIRHLKEQITLLEVQNKKLTETGNMLLKECEDLESICMRQQEVLEGSQTVFPGQPPQP